jgi:hypothetical protein
MDLCDEASFFLDYRGYLTRKLFPTIDVFFKHDYTPLDNYKKNFFSNKSGLVILRHFSALMTKLLCFRSIVGKYTTKQANKQNYLKGGIIDENERCQSSS